MIEERTDRSSEAGQVVPIFALLLTVLMMTVAYAIDVGVFAGEQNVVQNAVDSGALAAATHLPDDPATAETIARDVALDNDPDLDSGDVGVGFLCVAGDRNLDGIVDPADVPALCDPGLGTPFSCADGRCIAECVPALGLVTCNAVLVSANKTVDHKFADVGGIDTTDTGDLRAAACVGACGGEPSAPADVMLVIDRTGSMSSADLRNAKNAARAVLEIFNAEKQHVGLVVLGASDPSNPCGDRAPGSGGVWRTVGLSSDYQNADGSLRESSTLVSRIECLRTSSQGTNLGSPLSDTWFARPDAIGELTARGRPGVKKGIIMLSDGEANEPGLTTNCGYAHERATAVKALDVELYTIGFGIDGKSCRDWWGPYRNAPVTRLLADMSTGPKLGGDTCTAAENTDGDHFFCEARSADLAPVFRQAASDLAGGSRLIRVP